MLLCLIGLTSLPTKSLSLTIAAIYRPAWPYLAIIVLEISVVLPVSTLLWRTVWTTWILLKRNLENLVCWIAALVRPKTQQLPTYFLPIILRRNIAPFSWQVLGTLLDHHRQIDSVTEKLLAHFLYKLAEAGKDFPDKQTIVIAFAFCSQEPALFIYLMAATVRDKC